MKRSKCAVFAVLAGVFLCVGMRPAWAETTWYVDDDAPADFATIQAAIDASADGDTIIVRDGLYRGDGNRDIDFGGKAVHLRSENGPEGCVIDCQGSEGEPHRGVVFQSGEDETSILDGFTIVGGYAPGDTKEDRNGGGIDCANSSPTIANNVITGNNAEYDGGGICAIGASVIANNVITDNTAGHYGGGIRNSGPAMIADNIIASNSGSGGGVRTSGSPILTSNIIVGNIGGGYGGGIRNGGSLTLVNSVIAGNSAGTNGGGIWTYDSGSVSIINNVFTGNRANVSGGGIHARRYQSVTITNSIVWGNIAPRGREISQAYSSSLTIRYNNIGGGQSGIPASSSSTVNWEVGNIDTAPLFVDPSHWNNNGTPDDTSDDTWINGDYHLKSEDGRWDSNAHGGDGDWVHDDVTSPCINGGDPTSDYSNEPLFNGGRINMGAYGNTSEASQGKWILPADTNHDSEVNVLDLLVVRNLLREDPTTGDNWRGDVNEDGVINILDLLYTRNHLGTNRE